MTYEIFYSDSFGNWQQVGPSWPELDGAARGLRAYRRIYRGWKLKVITTWPPSTASCIAGGV